MDQTVVQLDNATISQYSRPVLSNVNLSLNKGEFVYLIGKTGSGKSSLLKTLYGSLPLAGGNGMVAGFNLRELNLGNIHLLRRKLGMIFQENNLLTDRTIFQNLQFVLQATGWKQTLDINNRCKEVLEYIDMYDHAGRMPYEMSAGEQQRIMVARAIINYPELLIADEPTGNLDPGNSDDLIALLRNLTFKNNLAVIMASHDYRILDKFPGKVLRCEHGAIERYA